MDSVYLMVKRSLLNRFHKCWQKSVCLKQNISLTSYMLDTLEPYLKSDVSRWMLNLQYLGGFKLNTWPHAIYLSLWHSCSCHFCQNHPGGLSFCPDHRFATYIVQSDSCSSTFHFFWQWCIQENKHLLDKLSGYKTYKTRVSFWGDF